MPRTATAPKAPPKAPAKGTKLPSATDDAGPRRVRRSPEAAREHILGAARELIAEHGPDGVGLKDVGVAAGVSHTLVVHYFGSYENLVQEVLRQAVARFRAQVLERVVAEAPGGLDPASWIGVVFDELRERAASRLLLWGLLSGRFEAPDAFFRKEQGLRTVVDAVEARIGKVIGPNAIDRTTLETAMVIGIAASWGYAFGGRAIWGSLGREATKARDASVRDRLASALYDSALKGATSSAQAREPTPPPPEPRQTARARRPRQ